MAAAVTFRCIRSARALTLNGSNSNSGDSVGEGDVVAINDSASYGASNDTLILAGGELDLIGAVSTGMARGVVLKRPAAVAADDVKAVLNSIMSGSRLVTKRGIGTLNLSGTNSYSGGTVVTAGSLDVGTTSALGTGSLALAGVSEPVSPPSPDRSTVLARSPRSVPLTSC
jgi:autotransporter-associated beta strand protein